MNAFTKRHYRPEYAAEDRRELKRRMQEAISWGVPCQESIGMSPTTLTSLLAEALRTINALEQELKEVRDEL